MKVEKFLLIFFICASFVYPGVAQGDDGDSVTDYANVIEARAQPQVKHLLVLLWNQQDPAVTVPDAQTIDDLIFGPGKSVKNYYAQESGGKIDIQKAGVMGWYPALKPAEHYWADPDPTDADGDGFISGHNEKWVEAIRDADPDFDYSSYDFNHDHHLDPTTELGVLIVIPSAGPFGTNRPIVGREAPIVEPLIVDGVSIGVIAEVYAGTPPNFGAFAHEIGHLLFGFTDMYMESPYRAGGYSIFDSSYSNSEVDPWEKTVAGWINQAVVTESGTYELEDIAVGHTVVKIPRPNSSEFFIIENRELNTYQDVGQPGLLIWDILNPSTAGDWGRNNIHLLRSNGGTPVNDANAAYHGTSDTDLGVVPELKWSDGSSSGISLSGISVPGPKMRFTLKFATAD